MQYIIAAVLDGMEISEGRRPRDAISKIRIGVAETISRSNRVKYSREEKVRRICEQMFHPLKFPSIRPPWLVNHRTGKCMEIDLCCSALNLAIECQGEQHVRFVPWFHKTYDEYLDMRRRDLLKAAILKTKQIKLVYVPSIKRLPDECLESYLMSHI